MSNAPIGIIGYGELGRQLELLAAACGWPGDFVYFDDEYCRQGGKAGHPFYDYRKEEFRNLNFLIGIGYRHLQLRKRLFEEIAGWGGALPSLLHPTAFVHPTAQIGPGAYVYPVCNIDKNVVVERGALLNNSVVVSHDSRIGEASFLSPGVVITSFVTIGAGVFMGAGALVSNQLTIGEAATVGIGTVVTRNLEAGKFYIGNPMKEIRNMKL